VFTAFIVVNKSANERKKGTHAPATPPTPDRAARKQTRRRRRKTSNKELATTAAQADVLDRAGKIRPSGVASGFIWAQKGRGYIGPSP